MSDIPLLRVERGDPSDEELAALVSVVAARLAGAGESERPTSRRTEWADPARSVRRPHKHGPGGWRASAFPR